MNIKITTNHGLEKTDAIINYVNNKLEKLLKKFNLENSKLEVELEKTNNHHHKGDIYKVSINVSKIDRNIFISETANELYSCIDKVEKKLEYQLSSNKDKKKTFIHRFGKKIKDMIKGGR